MNAQEPVVAALPALAPGPVLVGYSGGVDVTTLLLSFAHLSAYRRVGLRAEDIHHGLHHAADDWAAHYQAT